MKSSLITSALALAGSALGASLEQVNDFGENSSNVRHLPLLQTRYVYRENPKD